MFYGHNVLFRYVEFTFNLDVVQIFTKVVLSIHQCVMLIYTYKLRVGEKTYLSFFTEFTSSS